MEPCHHRHITTDLSRSPYDVPQSDAEFVLLATNARSSSWTFEATGPLCWWPHADLFAQRQLYQAMPQPPGSSIELFGGPFFEGDGRGVLWIVNAIYPCPPKEAWNSDKRSKRVKNFADGLGKFRELLLGGVDLRTLVVPQFMGCVQHQEDWPLLLDHLENFAAALGVRILVTKSVAACGDQAPYTRPPPRPLTQGERKFQKKLLGLVAPPVTIMLTGGGGAAVTSAAFVQTAEQKAEVQAMMVDPLMFALASVGTSASRQKELEQTRETALLLASSNNAAASIRQRSPKRTREEAGEETEANSRSPKRQMTQETQEEVEKGVVKKKKWTTESWKQAHITDKFTPQYIEWARNLRQGEDEWLHCEGKRNCLTTSKFGACHAAMTGGSAKGLQEVGKRSVWRKSIPANKYMQWGSYHEDDGKGAFATALAFGLMGMLEGEETPFDMEETPFIQMTNRQLLEWSAAAEVGESPWEVEEVMDSRGVNIDVEDKVLAYSYDGLYRLRRRGTDDPWKHVLSEVKCTSTMLSAPRKEHMCQMMGMLGGLRKQGYAIDSCIYVNWQRHATRFWKIPFEPVTYAQLLREMLWVWYNFLLPLFVARDNGILPEGRLDVPVEIEDMVVEEV